MARKSTQRRTEPRQEAARQAGSDQGFNGSVATCNSPSEVITLNVALDEIIFTFGGCLPRQKAGGEGWGGREAMQPSRAGYSDPVT